LKSNINNVKFEQPISDDAPLEREYSGNPILRSRSKLKVPTNVIYKHKIDSN